jgi:molecular chaperone GrpE
VKTFLKKRINDLKNLKADIGKRLSPNSQKHMTNDSESAETTETEITSKDSAGTAASGGETQANAATGSTADTAAGGSGDDGVFDDGTGAAGSDDDFEALALENARLREQLARAAADFANFRRRTEREKEDLRKFAATEIAEKLIPMLDNLDIGLAAAEKHPEAAPVTSGFKMIGTQIRQVLGGFGLVEINPLGEPFDPNYHESISQMPSDTVPEHNVAAVARVGYRIHERLVRPASVVLSTGPAAGATGAVAGAVAESAAGETTTTTGAAASAAAANS